jgi:hypothetical protein
MAEIAECGVGSRARPERERVTRPFSVIRFAWQFFLIGRLKPVAILETAEFPAFVAGVVLPLLCSAALTFVSLRHSRQAVDKKEVHMHTPFHDAASMVICSVTTVIAAALASVAGSALLA